MKNSDRAIAELAERDQSDADLREMTREIATFYKKLVARRVPDKVAGPITRSFAAMVVFPGCSCPMEGP